MCEYMSPVNMGSSNYIQNETFSFHQIITAPMIVFTDPEKYF